MYDCGSECDCKGDVNRRDFLKIGVTAAGLLAGTGVGSRGAEAAEPGYIPPECRRPPGPEWFEQLRKAGGPIVYSGENLQNIIFPLGGLGTGTVWLNGAGRLVNWQIFNNIYMDSQVDDTFFVVRVEQEGSPPIVRALRAAPVGPVKGIENISFCGQYPIASLKFKDSALPVEVELEAFNPLVPLDEQASGLPCAIFTVRAKNLTQKPMKVSILGTLQNAVGHNGQGSSKGVWHGTYGGNINELVEGNAFTAIAMRAEPGRHARIDPPVELFMDEPHVPWLEQAPVTGLSMGTLGVSKANAAIKSIYWLADGDLKLIGGGMLSLIAEDIRRYGAFLMLGGGAKGLVEGVTANVSAEANRRETVFASFDNNNFGQWDSRGEAFSRGPSHGPERKQEPISGYTGVGFANSHMNNEDVLGKLRSPSFQIRDGYISFLIGGGAYPGTCCLNLIVDGKVVRSETGRNTEQLRRVEWDVNDLINKDAIIELVDQQTGKMGHLLVDDIRFSNLAIDAVTVADAKAWNEIVSQLKTVPAMTAIGLGKGRAMLVPADLATSLADPDAYRQRDQVLSQIAKLAEVNYEPPRGRPADAPSFGTMCLAMPEKAAATSLCWTDAEKSIKSFVDDGTVPSPGAKLNGAGKPVACAPTAGGHTANGGMWKNYNLDADQTAEATFVMAWHFPNQYYQQMKYKPVGNSTTLVGNMYANRFPDATAVVRHVMADLDNLRLKTYAYRDAVFNTTLPQYLVDAAAANVSILRSPTCFWVKDGTFFGYEGCRGKGGGCCPMNCSHVWNYEQTLAKLWPGLEQNMRITELKFHQEPDGGIHHRVSVPRGAPGYKHYSVADGQCGAVLKAYREHLASSDRRFLDDHWTYVKKAMDYAIKTWDTDGDGIMDAAQYNTYDGVIHGQNTFVSSLYLAALRAAEEMAKLSSDENAAARYRGLFDKGRKQIAETLFNGEYYIQIAKEASLGYGKGCFTDQVVGQWWARILNLGDILPVEQVRSALAAIYKHNWLWSQEGFVGTERFKVFADGKDKAMLNCSWPKGSRPANPIRYRDEAWTGVEYQVAAHKIFEGQVDEGLTIVCGVRERYNGIKKSPWNEIECGDYYVRAMAAWSLLLAAQGYAYDGPNGKLAFDPRIDEDNHRSFFSTADGWGTFGQKRHAAQQLNSLAVAVGRCDLSELRLGLPSQAKSVSGSAHAGDRPVVVNVAFDKGSALVRFEGPISVAAGERLDLELSWQR